MTRSLAEQVVDLNLKDAKSILDANRNQINNTFLDEMVNCIHKARAEENFGRAEELVRILHAAGQAISNSYYSAHSFYEQALIEADKKQFDHSLKRLEQCILECSKTTDKRANLLRADANYFAGFLYQEQVLDADRARDYMLKAQELYRIAANQEKLEDIARRLTQIEAKIADKLNARHAVEQRLSERLAEIIESRQRLASLRQEVASQEAQLEQLKREKAKLESDQQQLQNAYQALKQQSQQLEQKLKATKQHLRLARTAHDVPLWAAVIRSDMESGAISQESLHLIERLIDLAHSEEAKSLLLEVRARSGWVPNEPIDTKNLRREQRLFAEIINSELVRTHGDHLGSTEALLEAWEVYLGESF